MEIKTKFSVGDKVYYMGHKGPEIGYVESIKISIHKSSTSCGVVCYEDYALEYFSVDDGCRISLDDVDFTKYELFATMEELIKDVKRRIMDLEKEQGDGE